MGYGAFHPQVAESRTGLEIPKNYSHQMEVQWAKRNHLNGFCFIQALAAEKLLLQLAVLRSHQ